MKAGDIVLARGGQLDGKQILLLEQHGRSWKVKLLENAPGEFISVLKDAVFWYNFEQVQKKRKTGLRRKGRCRPVRNSRKMKDKGIGRNVTEEG